MRFRCVEAGRHGKHVGLRMLSPFDVLAADVPIKFSALTRSCVVIPCTFQDDDHVPMTRGIWAKKNGDIVYHNGQSQVVDHFKGRTRIQGNLQEGHCSLEIDDIKPFDNGPFCFHAEKRDDKYKFNNSCVFVLMRASPDEPAMTPVPAEADAGSTLTVSCSVAHTCPSHPPVFSWSVPNLTSAVSHTMTSRGVWEMTSTISFVAAGGDGVHSLNCTATFWGGKQQTSVVNLSVKGERTTLSCPGYLTPAGHSRHFVCFFVFLTCVSFITRVTNVPVSRCHGNILKTKSFHVIC
uniref:Si:dkey-238d18.7 n=1 Tax=Salarias fasciatus TaxID=181472 RepID=A0A672FXT7_SALFA